MKTHTMRVLLVETAPDTVCQLRQVTEEITGVQFEWVSVDTVPIGLDLLAKQPFDVILLDLDQSGVDALDELHAALPEIPIVTLSDLDDAQAAVDAMQRGAQDWLVKDQMNGPMLARVLFCTSARQRAVNPLRQSAAEMQALFTAMSDVILVLDAEGRYIKVGPTAPHLLYRPTAEILGKTMHDIFPAEQADFFLAHVRHALRTGETTSMDYSLEIGGAQIWFSAQVSPMQPDLVVLVARDITQRKQAEDALRQAEKRFHNIYDNALEGIFQSTPEGRYLHVNPTMARIFGYASPEDMIDTVGNDIEHRIHVDPIRRADFMRLMDEEGVVPDFEAPNRRKNGDVIWTRTKARAVRDVDGNLLYYEGFLEDITEHKKAEDALRQSQENLQTLFNTIDDFLFILDDEARIIHVNRTVEDRMGYTTPELYGMSATVVHPPDLREAAVSILTDILTGKCSVCPIPLLAKDSTLIPVETRVTHGQWNGKNALFGISRDITERLRAEKLMQTQHDLAIALNATTSLQEGLRLCLDTVLHVSGMDCGGVYLVDKNSGDLDLVVHAGSMSPDLIQCATHYEASAPQTHLVMKGHPIYTAYQEMDLPKDKLREREKMRAFGVIPLQHLGHVIGCLNIASHTLDEVPPGAREAIETIAAQMGSVIIRLKAEAALQQSEERFRAFIEHASDAICLIDGNATFLYVSPSFEWMCGYTPEELIGRNSLELWSPDDVPITLEALALMRPGTPVRIEMYWFTVKWNFASCH